MGNLDNVRKKLLERKQELEKVMFNNLHEKISDGQVQDTGDQAFSSSLEELKISLHNTELAEYNMLNRALAMIDEGTYGLCTDCGNPIAEKRLLMYPNATRCITCQEAIEEGRL